MSDEENSDASASYTSRQRGRSHRRHARDISLEREDDDNEDNPGLSLADELHSGAGESDMSMRQSSTFATEHVGMRTTGINLQDELSCWNDHDGGHPSDAAMTGSRPLVQQLQTELGRCTSGSSLDIPNDGPSSLEMQDNDDTSMTQRQAGYESMYIALTDAVHSTDAYIASLKTSTDGGDTKAMEQVARQVVLALQKSAREREGQAKELQDMIRMLDRGDGDVLPSCLLQTLSEDDGGAVRAFGSLPSPLAEEASAVKRTGSVSSSFKAHSRIDSFSSTISGSGLPPPGPSRKAPVHEHLSHLRNVTTSLIASLQSLNEHTQINNAVFRESAKFLRRINLQLTDMIQELDSVDASRAWIESRGQKGLKPHINSSVGEVQESVREWSRHQMAEYEMYLDDAAARARLLLCLDV